MKRLLLLLAILFSVQYSFGQTPEVKLANEYFDRAFYSEAIPMYEKIAKNDNSLEVTKNLADSYYYTNDLENAGKWYKTMIKKNPKYITDEYYFRYIHTLKAAGKYAQADSLARTRIIVAKGSVKVFDKDVKILENIAGIGDRFEIENLAINTKNSDFGAVKYGERLVYSSPTKEKKTYRWNGENYLDFYTIPVFNAKSGDSISEDFSKSINTRMHESNAVFTKNGKTMYFTRNNPTKDKNMISHLQLYKAEFKKGQWTNITALPFNSPNYSTEHPALSEDEEILYFASDMPGTLGSFDIFSVEINGGKFGIPKNLGPVINTIHKEQFPFISDDGKLYFSSNGHHGFGSMDVFVSEFSNGKFEKPNNVGFPVNSGYDDFSFNMNYETKEGYFASNRPGGKGNDDIYQIKEIKPLVIEDCKQTIEGLITDIDSKIILAKATVVLQDVDKKEIQRVETDGEGKFLFTVPCEADYIIIASKEEYLDGTKSLKLFKDRNKINDGSIALKSVANSDKETLTEEQIAKKREDKIARAKKQERIDHLMEKEKDVVQDNDRLMIKTDPIYFDYDLWYIRKESKPILNRVIEIMKKYPKMTVEIGSHTDVRASDAYNNILSEKRAASTRRYFISKGIESERVTAKGYGETRPIVRCVPEDSCDEEQHELNRRSEFVIQNF
ncbi:OmpA family protein [uncultured Flavobacterium sp.]|uniref:OmpA family protein n=1 Tax=uncultured Flavobacterium sp. TaxID=165435 RepID=UPI0025D29254|nr:OmpA family protein [uncultured Flavobacterium sp.]